MSNVEAICNCVMMLGLLFYLSVICAGPWWRKDDE